MAKNKGGRPTQYSEEKRDTVYKLCLLGATDKQIADILGIAESTLNNWKNKYPEFMESITRGKMIADAEVAHSLRHRAIGYSHKAVKIFNNGADKQPSIIEYTEHYPPDTQAAAIWLYNRHPDKWKRSPSPDDDDDEVVPVKINISVVDASKRDEP